MRIDWFKHLVIYCPTQDLYYDRTVKNSFTFSNRNYRVSANPITTSVRFPTYVSFQHRSLFLHISSSHIYPSPPSHQYKWVQQQKETRKSLLILSKSNVEHSASVQRWPRSRRGRGEKSIPQLRSKFFLFMFVVRLRSECDCFAGKGWSVAWICVR